MIQGVYPGVSLDASINRGARRRLFSPGMIDTLASKWKMHAGPHDRRKKKKKEKSAGEEERIETKRIDTINSDARYKFHGVRSSDFARRSRTVLLHYTSVIGEWHQGRRNNALWTTSAEEMARRNSLKRAWKNYVCLCVCMILHRIRRLFYSTEPDALDACNLCMHAIV